MQLEPLLAPRPPVLIEQRVAFELCRLARRGYETPHKQETFGFLHGSLTRARLLVVRQATPYRGGNRTRSGVSFPDWPSVRRVLDRRERLARRHRMRFLGGFHSHVEIGGQVFSGLSESDRRSLRRDYLAALEGVISIWAGGSRRSGSGSRTVALFERATGYSYRLRIYLKTHSGIRQTRSCLRLPDGSLSRPEETVGIPPSVSIRSRCQTKRDG